MADSKAVKAPNYTPEQVALMLAMYAKDKNVDVIAVALGKTKKSVVAKLSKEGVYEKAEYVTKSGAPAVKKEAHADAIGALLGLNENDTSSLAKANKSALSAIVVALQSCNEAIMQEAEEEAAAVE